MLEPQERTALLYVRQHGDRTVAEFSADHALRTWCALFNRGLVMVLHCTICLTLRGEEALRR